MLEIDLLGLVNLVGAAQPHLEEAAAKRGDAAIVAISSVSAALANRPEAYGAIKGALIHLVKGYARALAAKKIRANVVSPWFDLFCRWVLGPGGTRAAGVFQGNAGAQPLGPDGHTRRDRSGHGVSRQPALELHHGREFAR